jgi:hypothetical protein
MKPARPKYDLEFFYTSFPERDLVEWYQWEFLRRNSKYRANYKKFLDDHRKWLDRKGYWYDLARRPQWTERDERFFNTKIAPDIIRLCVKWQIADLHPPQWRFSKLDRRDYLPERSSRPATGSPPEMNWDHKLIMDLQRAGFTGKGGSARRCGHLFLVEFDLRWPMKDQLDFAERVLRRARDNYRFGFGGRKPDGRIPQGRRRFEDYDIHLKVWDLFKMGKSATEIAKRVFPTDQSQSVLQRVRDHLDAAERLISKHYKEIN